jgi:uncharacterized protein YegP (UPF0339 family)
MLVAEQVRSEDIVHEDVGMRYIIYMDVQGQWRWHLLAANNRKIANSGEGYFNKQDCLHAVQLVKGSAFAPVYEQ